MHREADIFLKKKKKNSRNLVHNGYSGFLLFPSAYISYFVMGLGDALCFAGACYATRWANQSEEAPGSGREGEKVSEDKREGIFKKGNLNI